MKLYDKRIIEALHNGQRIYRQGWRVAERGTHLDILFVGLDDNEKFYLDRESTEYVEDTEAFDMTIDDLTAHDWKIEASNDNTNPDHLHWWKLSSTQKRVLSPLVRGKNIVDLGAGNHTLAIELIKLGAKHVTLVESKECFDKLQHPQIVWIDNTTFDQFALQNRLDWDLAFLSWPQNNTSLEATIPILRRTKTVAYLGKNWGGTQCGTPNLWAYLIQRQLIAAAEEPNNSLLIYGQHTNQKRNLYWEELLGLKPLEYYHKTFKKGTSNFEYKP